MYTPSMFFGGSSLIHLLASHPRVVAFFGISALIGSMLQSPFGTPDVMGTAGYVKQLEQVARQNNAVNPEIVADAHKTARVLAQLPTSRLTEIVGDTLRECGAACDGVQITDVLKSRALLADVLLLHTLNDANAQITVVRAKAAPATVAAVTP
jgi:hypothetical protein